MAKAPIATRDFRCATYLRCRELLRAVILGPGKEIIAVDSIFSRAGIKLRDIVAVVSVLECWRCARITGVGVFLFPRPKQFMELLDQIRFFLESYAGGFGRSNETVSNARRFIY